MSNDADLTAYKHAWYLRNKARLREKARKWRQENRTKLRLYHRAWKKRNPEKLHGYYERYYYGKRHKEILACNRGRYRARREQMRAYQRAWREKHRAELNARRRKDYWRNHAREIARHQARYRKHHARELRRSRERYRKQRELHLRRVMAWRERNRERWRTYKRVQESLRNAKKRESRGSFTQEEWRQVCIKFNWRCAICGRKRPLTIDHIVPISRGGHTYISNIQPLCQSCNSKKGAKFTRPRHHPRGASREPRPRNEGCGTPKSNQQYGFRPSQVFAPPAWCDFLRSSRLYLHQARREKRRRKEEAVQSEIET